ncbi:cold shock domain-containing protein [Yinghuangia sp. ASG 101]|uniref:cold-shock protein n=1 Tax=Yinghuangia sp. ASG 101 TaxID=2896848 RepID=UPI001E2C63AD|nr:cold shock domain-containing protein [Yinghuangia sp. ASG 101]UGQ14526.1 cold shock domain-containing protein [Yinghuangia sp. ASG 101]
MPEGTFKRVGGDEGRGVIIPDDGGPDVHVRADLVRLSGHESLDEGRRVSFDAVDGPYAPLATRVTPLSRGKPYPPLPDEYAQGCVVGLLLLVLVAAAVMVWRRYGGENAWGFALVAAGLCGLVEKIETSRLPKPFRQAGRGIALSLALAALGFLVWGGDDRDTEAAPTATGGVTAPASPPATGPVTAPGVTPPPSSPAPAATEGVPLPVVVTAPGAEYISHEDEEKARRFLPPVPDEHAPTTEKLLYELRLETLLMAGAPGETSATCEGGRVSLGAGATTGCTVVYEGVEVRWTIRIESGGMLVQYVLIPQRGVVTATGVYGAFWERYQAKEAPLRCGEIPRVAAVEPDQGTGYTCQFLDTSAAPNRWVDLPVTLTRWNGLAFGTPPRCNLASGGMVVCSY